MWPGRFCKFADVTNVLTSHIFEPKFGLDVKLKPYHVLITGSRIEYNPFIRKRSVLMVWNYLGLNRSKSEMQQGSQCNVYLVISLLCYKLQENRSLF